MMAVWDIPVTGIDQGTVHPDHLHAVASRWLDHDQHWSTTKPWAVNKISVVDSVVCLSLVTLTEPAGRRISDAAVAGKPIRLGEQHGRILARPALRQILQPEQLIKESTAFPQRAAVWNFLTPTTFRSGDRTTPLPDPRRVINSMTARWTQLYPHLAEKVALSPADVASVMVTDIDGSNTVFKVNQLTVSGFVGRVRYQCGTQASQAALSILSGFAAVAGVGSYTTRGLGRVAIEQTWEQELAAYGR